MLKIFRCCKINNIRLFFIQSPNYAQVDTTLSTKYITRVAEENNVTFWNFSNSPDFLSTPAYFQDQGHLNDNGAVFFSNIVVNVILLLNNLILMLDSLVTSQTRIKLLKKFFLNSSTKAPAWFGDRIRRILQRHPCRTEPF